MKKSLWSWLLSLFGIVRPVALKHEDQAATKLQNQRETIKRWWR